MQSNLIRTSQPKVPFSLEGTNSMRRGLSFFLDTSSKIPRDLVTGVALSQGSVPPNNGATLRGYLGTTFSATGDNTFITLPNTTLRSASSAYSILIGFSTTANHTGNPRALVSKSDGAPSNNGFNFVHTNNTSVAVQCKNTTDLGTISAANPTNINDGQPQWAAISLNKTSGQPWSVRLNKTTSTPANLTGTWNFSSPTARLGNSIDPYWPDFDGHIFYVAIWERYVVPQEWDQIFANPWQLFQPEKRSRLWAAPVPSVKMTPLPAKGPSIIVKPRMQQPQIEVGINRGNPITADMVDVILPHTFRSTVRNLPGIISGGTQSTEISTIGITRKFTANSSTERDTYANTSFLRSGNFTFLTFYRLYQIPPTATGRVAGTFVNNSAGYMVAPNNTNFRALVSDGVNLTLIGSTVSLNPKVDILLYSGGFVSLYENGVLTSGPTAKTITVGTSNFFIGSDVAGTGPTCPMNIALTAIWGRALSNNEILSISRNPWQIFAPQDRLWLPTYSDRVIPQLSNPTVANLTSTGGTPRYTITY